MGVHLNPTKYQTRSHYTRLNESGTTQRSELAVVEGDGLEGLDENALQIESQGGRPRAILVQISFLDRERKWQSGLVWSSCLVDSVHPPPPMQRWATALQFVIPTGAHPDFLLRCTHQRPRVRLSVWKAA